MGLADKAFSVLKPYAEKLLSKPLESNEDAKLVLDLYTSGVLTLLDMEETIEVEEVHNEKPKEEKPKRTRKTKSKKTEEPKEEASIKKAEDIPVTDFEGNVVEEPKKSAMEILGSEDKVDEEPVFQAPENDSVEDNTPAEETKLEFNEKQLDFYVSEFKREQEKPTKEDMSKLKPKADKIRAFAQEAVDNKKLLAQYLDEIMEDEDKGKITLRNITPYYIDMLSHYLVLREEIKRYDDDKIVEAMKELSGGVLNKIEDLNRYNIEAILTVLKGL